jgi:peptidoglycan/LPS O-acetylase OafA/YrhL
MGSRLQEIDILRSLAIIFIVFAHIDRFINLPIMEKLRGIFAVLGLSFFFFISGFLMKLNNNFNNNEEIFSFIKKRATKIYPMYWLSIFFVYIMNKLGFYSLFFNNIDTDKSLLLLNILGLQGIFSENYSLSIWWFVGVILLYYFVFSIVLYYSKNDTDLLIYSSLSVIFLLFLKNEFNLINVNVFIFYFAFLGGILSVTVESSVFLNKIVFFYSFLLILFLSLHHFGIDINNLVDIRYNAIYLILLIFFILYKVKFLHKNIFKVPRMVQRLADSSYSIYLFHISILTLLEFFIGLLIPLNTFNSCIKDYLMLFIGVPLTLFLCYYIKIQFSKFCDIVYKKSRF